MNTGSKGGDWQWDQSLEDQKDVGVKYEGH